MGLLDRFFQDDDEPEDSVAAQASEILEFQRAVYFSKFMEYLDAGADEPMKITGQMEMIVAATRSNTFKEIRRHLRRQIESASEAMERMK